MPFYKNNIRRVQAIKWNGVAKSLEQFPSDQGSYLTTNREGTTTEVLVSTLDGIRTASIGDYIVRAGTGKFEKWLATDFEDEYQVD